MRYTQFGQEVIFTDDKKLLGICIGYDFCSEHEWGYDGRISTRPKRKHNDPSPTFAEAIIDKPECVELVECDDGLMALASHTLWGPLRDIEDRYGYLENHPDVRCAEPDHRDDVFFDAFWDERNFLIFGIDGYSSKILEELNECIKAKDVAVSADFRPLFKNRGLSFVVVSRIPSDKTKAREDAIRLEKLALDARADLEQWLKDQCNESWCYSAFNGAVWLSNVQPFAVYDVEGSPETYFYFEPHDMLAWNRSDDYEKDNISSCVMFDIPHMTNALGVKKLYEIGNSGEYIEQAASLDHVARQKLLNKMWRKAMGDSADIADGTLACKQHERLL